MSQDLQVNTPGSRLSAATFLAAFVVLAGGAREIVIARVFGVSTDLDIYLIASAMPLAMVSLFSGSWQSAATPELADAGLGTAGTSYLRVVRVTAIPLTVIAVTAALLATGGVVGIEDGFIGYLLLLAVSVLLGVLSAGRYPLALTSGRSNLVIAAPAALHFGIAISVLAFGPLPVALYGGLLLGSLLLYVCLRKYALPRGFDRSLTIGRDSARRIFRNLVPIAGGGAAMALALPVDLLFAARAAQGGPSIVNYATRVPLAASVVGASVISTVIFADLVASRKDTSFLHRRVKNWIRLAAAFSVVSAACLWIASPLIAEVLFGSEKLGGSDLLAIAQVQQLAALSIPPFLVGIVLVRGLNATEVNRPLFWISLANIAINIAGNWLLTPILGLSGIMLSTAVMYTVSALLLWLTWRHLIAARGKSGAHT